jgi:hypothetical protein
MDDVAGLDDTSLQASLTQSTDTGNVGGTRLLPLFTVIERFTDFSRNHGHLANLLVWIIALPPKITYCLFIAFTHLLVKLNAK